MQVVAWCLTLLVLVLISQHAECKNKKKRRGSKWGMVREMQANLTALWKKVEALSQPVQIYVHGMEEGNVGYQGHHEGQGRNGSKPIHIHFNLPGSGSKHSSSAQHGSDGGGSSRMNSDGYTYATCHMIKNVAFRTAHQVHGNVSLRQRASEPLEIKVNLHGFLPSPRRLGPNNDSNLHGLHVHEFGDFSSGCNSFGGHFNPHNTTHGGPNDRIRHAGDWGNVMANYQGTVQDTLTDGVATLFGPHSIIGRSIVVHDKADDLGRGGKPDSLTTGAAGGRLACCVIAVTRGGY